ncbi:hypothetical protein DXA60_00500 [Roseburia sp. OF03-24]|uniref:hypothetical protein n=1 Tax=Roseburia sp. OF03-24 TaxID=2292367 RepID=UPI000E4A5474|nr:hypothetical protein [Roseburia sp. OF03-24]RGX95297.1 hypothetical protein DXA60_00500 [Roseburia sp. OF03-24]
MHHENCETGSGIENKYEKLKHAVAEGRKVLFFGTGIREEYTIPGTYCTDFWCYPMFASISESMNRPKPVGTMGLYIQSEHPALAEFVTEEYETPQWWDIITDAKAAILDGTDIEPIVWVIDNFRSCMFFCDRKFYNLIKRYFRRKFMQKKSRNYSI